MKKYNPSEYKIGSKIDIIDLDSISREDLQVLKQNRFILTISELDTISGQVYGVYTIELPKILFPVVNFKLL